MRVLEVKVSFKPKIFVAMLAVCAAIAGVAAWVTGLNFWVLGAFLVIGVLINGVIMSIEDKDTSRKRSDEPPP
jgi:membrane protein implicated in regulation of membrane protease activity